MQSIRFSVFLVLLTLLTTIIPTDLLAWYYYNNGKKIYVDKIKSIKRNKSEVTYIKTPDNTIMGVGKRIVFYPKSDKCSKKILREFSNYIHKQIDNKRYVLIVNNPTETFDVANKIYESECTFYAHPDFIIFPRSRYLELDPIFRLQQWNLHNYGQFYSLRDIDINAYEAWLYTKGKGIKVALIDDGFDVGHEDLKDAFIGGYDVIKKTSNIAPNNPYEFHGTLCAGLIAARMNDLGIIGVAPEADLYGVKLLSNDQNGEPLPIYTSDIVHAFLAAKEADVISCSWGTYNVADSVREIINELAYNGRNGKGLPIVFASGNDGMPQYYWENDESALKSVIAVGAITNLGEHPWYSNYGSSLDFVAPSGGGTLKIATTDLRGRGGLAIGIYGHPDYAYAVDDTGFNGTSAAAPQVSGVIALMLARDPGLTRDEIIEILKSTAKKVGDIPYYNGRNDYFGYGLVDAEGAVREVIKRKVEATVRGKKYRVDGYFVHFGEKAFDWIYVDSGLKVAAKLEGMNAKGEFVWKLLAFNKIVKKEDRLFFLEPLYQDSMSSMLVGEYPIDGYFVHYDIGKFDWLYIDAQKHSLYKLEGLDYRKNIIWIELPNLHLTIESEGMVSIE
jgi:subtilisin family serine protease